MLRPTAAAAVLAAGLAAADARAVPRHADDDAPAILFIGNSLTSSNDLPRRVRAIAGAAGVRVVTEAVTRPDTSLLDHWDARAARQALVARRWTFVVLQQGPSTLPASREELVRATRLFADEARRRGAMPALLMPWPLPGQTQQAVAASYRAAAEATGALLVPAGEAWSALRAAGPAPALTVSDGFHPSRAGTEVAALSVVCTLLPGVPAEPGAGVEKAQAAAVRRAACPSLR